MTAIAEEDKSLKMSGYDRSDLKRIIYLDRGHLLGRYLDKYDRHVHMTTYDVRFEYIRSGVRAHMMNWIAKDYSIVFRDKSRGEQKVLVFNKRWEDEDD